MYVYTVNCILNSHLMKVLYCFLYTFNGNKLNKMDICLWLYEPGVSNAANKK